MRALSLTGLRHVLALGAHPDDLEIGAGGLLLLLSSAHPGLHVTYAVFTGDTSRHAESRLAAAAFLPKADLRFHLDSRPDGYLPDHRGRVKQALHTLVDTQPDLILCPRLDDAHQDHRLLAGLVPTVFRDHLILRYEVPKWDGDLGSCGVYVPLPDDVAQRKADLLDRHFPSQHHHDWWDREVFLGLARLRGMQCRNRYAEGFDCPKSTLILPAAV